MSASTQEPVREENVPPPLPPFASVLKSKEVEDPVNLWLHRPLAYAFVAAVYRTPVTRPRPAGRG